MIVHTWCLKNVHTFILGYLRQKSTDCKFVVIFETQDFEQIFVCKLSTSYALIKAITAFCNTL